MDPLRGGIKEKLLIRVKQQCDDFQYAAEIFTISTFVQLLISLCEGADPESFGHLRGLAPGLHSSEGMSQR